MMKRVLYFLQTLRAKKELQLSDNKNSAMLFYWPESGRQIRIEGITEKVSEEESAAYFSTRPRESQISAWASEQSSVIPDRQYLEDRHEYYKARFENKLVEKPPDWGGFRLIPDFFEFWRDGEFRLHDRIAYTMVKNSWVISRLAP